MSKGTSQIEEDIDEALRKCSFEVQGMWSAIRRKIQTESARPGHLLDCDGMRVSDPQLATLGAGCDSTTASRLRLELASRGLLVQSPDGTHYSPQLADIHRVRASGRNRASRCRSKDVKVLRNTRGVTGGVTCSARNTPPPPPASSPALSLPPDTPIPIPPPPPPPAPISEAGASVATGEKTARGRAKKPKAEPKSPSEYRRMTDLWMAEYPKAHKGAPYPWDDEDGPQAAFIWRSCKQSVPLAGVIFMEYLQDRSPWYEGHPLRLLRKDFKKFNARVAGKIGAKDVNGTPIGQGGKDAIPDSASTRRGKSHGRGNEESGGDGSQDRPASTSGDKAA